MAVVSVSTGGRRRRVGACNSPTRLEALDVSLTIRTEVVVSEEADVLPWRLTKRMWASQVAILAYMAAPSFRALSYEAGVSVAFLGR